MHFSSGQNVFCNLGRICRMLLEVLLCGLILHCKSVSSLTSDIVSQDYRLQKTCDVSSMNTTGVFMEFTTISNLRCGSVCLMTSSCTSYDICNNGLGKSCRLRFQKFDDSCSIPASESSACVNYVIESLWVTSTDVTETTTEAIVCQNGGTYDTFTGNCTCVLGCTGVFCEDCIIDCLDGKNKGYTGTKVEIYIKPSGFPYAFQVICDFSFAVAYVQSRTIGDVDFNRNWNDYNNGFGNISGDFWLGLKHIKAIIDQNTYEMWFLIFDGAQMKYFAYANFTLTDEADGYKVYCIDHQEADPNAFIPVNNTEQTVYGQPFMTYDRDTYGCATTDQGGWWFNINCSISNVNAPLPTMWGTSPVVTSQMALKI